MLPYLSDNVKRNFAQSMLRLRRDSINFNEFNVNLKIEIDGESNIISYNVRNNCWVVKSTFLTSNEWNPKPSEMVEFLNHFAEESITKAIAIFDFNRIEIEKSLNSSGLKSKFIHIMDLLKFIENQQNSIFLPTEDGNVLYEISYSFENKHFQIMDVLNINPTPEIFTDESLDKLLDSFSYFDIITSLNNCFGSLMKPA